MKLHRRKVKELFSVKLGTHADIKKFADKIKSKIYTKVATLKVEAYCTPEPVNYANRKEGNKLSLKSGDSWGNLFDCAWFNFMGTVPDSAEGKCVVLEIDINGEAYIVDNNGNPLGTLTTGSTVYEPEFGDPGKTVWPITGSAASGNTINIWADAGNNDLFGNYHNNGSLNYAHVSIKNEEVEQLYFDYVILIDLLSCVNEKSARYQKIFHALHAAMVILCDFTEEQIAEAREVLALELARKNGDYPLQVSAIGHSHIDLAWLWPIRETIRKGARTFSNSLRMMERFPDFVFGASQPQLYQWIKEEYPELYNQVKERIAEGRWEPLGGMWVESDSNMVNGESFVR
ncbi:MAG: alpha-mannosidase, partial [Candidatus Heimdallarchaeota archaeon]|nr:alpha-mannosidase [Candidatus Heimdallarchaeota archaeon]